MKFQNYVFNFINSYKTRRLLTIFFSLVSVLNCWIFSTVCQFNLNFSLLLLYCICSAMLFIFT